MWLSNSINTLPETCATGSPITTLSVCNSWLGYNDRCGLYTVTSDAQSCFCQQSYVNALVGCENELRLCLGNGEEDALLQSVLSRWNKDCNGFMTFTPTTPTLSSVTDTDSFCNSVVSPACTDARTIMDGCKDLIRDEASFTSCMCQTDLILQDYSCELLGNTSCLATGATLSSAALYSMCSNFQQVIAAIPSDTSTTTTGPIPTILTATSPSPLPSTTQLIPTSTHGGSSSAGRMTMPQSVITMALSTLLVYYLI